MKLQEKVRSPKQIADAVAFILQEVNTKFKRKTVSLEKTDEHQDKTQKELDMHKKRKLNEKLRKERDLYIVELCREKNVSIKHIMTVGGFDLDKFEIN